MMYLLPNKFYQRCDIRFDNKVVIITGAAGGIGKEIARKLAAEGAKLTLVDLNEEAVQAIAIEFNLGEE